MGTLRDLATAGLVLREGLRLTIYDWSDETEQMEADAIVYYEPERQRWMAEFDEADFRYIPACERFATRPLVCLRCRALLEEVIAQRGLHWGDRCPSCGEAIHRPIAPP
jgi:hypothetical protein